MKKYLSLIFLGIMVAILLPAHINAASIKYSVDDTIAESEKETDRTSSPGYAITKYPIILNATTAYDKTFTVNITFTLNDSQSTYEFQPNTSAGVTAEKVSDYEWKLTITSLAVGENKIGIFKVKAVDATGIDCGGKYSLGEPVVAGTDTEEDNTTNNTNTGYSIPYIALAVGTVGTVTVIATSKKKNKFYKI